MLTELRKIWEREEKLFHKQALLIVRYDILDWKKLSQKGLRKDKKGRMGAAPKLLL